MGHAITCGELTSALTPGTKPPRMSRRPSTRVTAPQGCFSKATSKVTPYASYAPRILRMAATAATPAAVRPTTSTSAMSPCLTVLLTRSSTSPLVVAAVPEVDVAGAPGVGNGPDCSAGHTTVVWPAASGVKHSGMVL